MKNYFDNDIMMNNIYIKIHEDIYEGHEKFIL